MTFAALLVLWGFYFGGAVVQACGALASNVLRPGSHTAWSAVVGWFVVVPWSLATLGRRDGC